MSRLANGVCPHLADEVRAGQAVYSKGVLTLYDLLVLGVSSAFVWKCPARAILDLYNGHVTANHMEVGVGTGYFLDRCRFPVARPRIALLDLNQNCLQRAARRLRRYRPEVYYRDVLQAIAFSGEPFDSVGINYVLHCLPGPMARKAVAFDHLASLMNPGAVVFGATLLSRGVRRQMPARCLMRYYCKKRVFSNAEDSLDTLVRALEERFTSVEVHTVGCAGVFVARAL